MGVGGNVSHPMLGIIETVIGPAHRVPVGPVGLCYLCHIGDWGIFCESADDTASFPFWGFTTFQEGEPGFLLTRGTRPHHHHHHQETLFLLSTIYTCKQLYPFLNLPVFIQAPWVSRKYK